MDTFENNNGWETNSENTEQNAAYAEEAQAEQTRQEPVQRPGWQSAPQDGWTYPGNGPKAPKVHKEKKQKKGTGRVVALALCCAILGGIGGGAVMSFVAANRYESQTQELQQQIDDLKATGKSDTTILTSVSAEGLKSGAQIYAENVDAVVSVTAKGVSMTQFGNQNFESRGTGFLISNDGYILTNHHVIADGQEIKVTMNDSSEYEAKLIGSDEYFDVALLKIDGENLPAVTIGDSDKTAVGEEVVAIGNALGQLTSSFTGGYLSGVDRMVNSDGTAVNMMQTDAAINSGNSGGPLFNMKGEVIGITSAKYSGTTSSGASIEGIGFAIPINDVMKLVGDLRDFGYVTGQAYLGVTVKNMSVDASIAEAYGLPLGAQVQTVDAGSAAEKAGIQPKDIIIAIGDDKVESLDALTVALRKRSAGDTDTITVYRNGQELVLTITFDEKQVAAQQTTPETTEPQENNETIPQMPSQDDGWDEWRDFFYRYFGGRG